MRYPLEIVVCEVPVRNMPVGMTPTGRRPVNETPVGETTVVGSAGTMWPWYSIVRSIFRQLRLVSCS